MIFDFQSCAYLTYVWNQLGLCYYKFFLEKIHITFDELRRVHSQFFLFNDISFLMGESYIFFLCLVIWSLFHYSLFSSTLIKCEIRSDKIIWAHPHLHGDLHAKRFDFFLFESSSIHRHVSSILFVIRLNMKALSIYE